MKNLLSMLFFRREQKITDRVWDFLTSNVLAVVLVIVMAVISILGTVIPQKEPAQVYLKLYGEVFTNFFVFLGLTALFSSPLFILLSVSLALSLSSCTLKRLLKALNKKTNLRTWGSVAAHISILFIYAGVIYGNTAGFSTSIAIEKGSSYFEPREGFHVKLNDFNAKFDAMGRPLTYSSDLSVVEGGREVLRKTIVVNDPLSYKGIKFYQSSYGLNGMLEIKTAGSKPENIPIYKGGCAVYSATGQMFCVNELFPDINVIHGVATDVYEPKNPIAHISLHREGASEEIGWIMKGREVKSGNYTLKLLDIKEYTGLQVKRDPGVPLVYLGFLLLTIGVGVMLYTKK